MTRFQAQTNAVVDEELETLRRRLGLRSNQRADLLRELAALASWIVGQSEKGRVVEARGKDGVHPLVHPIVERIRRDNSGNLADVNRIELADDEVRKLAEVFERGFAPTPELRNALRRLSDPERTPPTLSWNEAST